MNIPESVVAAAEYVASWASKNSRGDSWEIGRCASRHELIRLRAKNERLRVDAERYRWLRENVVHCELVGWKTSGSLNAMDETIDAALAAGGEK